MLPATQAKALSAQVNAVGQELFDYFIEHVDPVIQSAAERGGSSANLVQVTATTKHFVAVGRELTQLGYSVALHSDPSPSAQHLIVSW